MIGHLRDVKDPLRAAEAARLLPADSRVRIEQVGRAYTPEWADARPRRDGRQSALPWRDDVPAAAVRRLLARSHAMVISSLSEGGANVISEAAVAGVPVLASRMDGNVGLLGVDYPGYFPVGDTKALARLLRRLEREPRFVARLAQGAGPAGDRCSGRRARLPPGAACSPTSAVNVQPSSVLRNDRPECRSWKNLKVAVSVAPSASPPRVNPNRFSGVIAKAAESTAAHRFPCSSVSSTVPMA